MVNYEVRLQNVNGGHSGTLAFYFCPFWGVCRQVTRACRQDYFLWSIFNYTEKPINTTAKAARMELWRERLEPLGASVHLNISPDEHLPAGAENPWTTWKALNRLRSQVGRSRVNMLNGDFPTNKKHVTVASDQADHATPTGLSHDGHCLLSPRPGNG